jgi:hypothetical protein
MRTIKLHGKVEVHFVSFLTLILYGIKSLSRPGRNVPGKDLPGIL